MGPSCKLWIKCNCTALFWMQGILKIIIRKYWENVTALYLNLPPKYPKQVKNQMDPSFPGMLFSVFFPSVWHEYCHEFSNDLGLLPFLMTIDSTLLYQQLHCYVIALIKKRKKEKNTHICFFISCLFMINDTDFSMFRIEYCLKSSTCCQIVWQLDIRPWSCKHLFMYLILPAISKPIYFTGLGPKFASHERLYKPNTP